MWLSVPGKWKFETLYRVFCRLEVNGYTSPCIKMLKMKSGVKQRQKYQSLVLIR